MTPGTYHNLLLPPPANLCAKEPSFPLKEKERRENNNMELFGLLLLTGCRCCTKCQITHARKKLMHEMDKLSEHMGFYLRTGSVPGFVRRITCNSGKTCTKGGCRNRFRQPRPTGKTYEDAQCSRSCSPECHLRSQGGQHQA